MLSFAQGTNSPVPEADVCWKAGSGSALQSRCPDITNGSHQKQNNKGWNGLRNKIGLWQQFKRFQYLIGRRLVVCDQSEKRLLARLTTEKWGALSQKKCGEVLAQLATITDRLTNFNQCFGARIIEILCFVPWLIPLEGAQLNMSSPSVTNFLYKQLCCTEWLCLTYWFCDSLWTFFSYAGKNATSRKQTLNGSISKFHSQVIK